MAIEILPSTSDGREASYDRTWDRATGSARVDHIDCPSPADGESLLASYILAAQSSAAQITQIQLRVRKGRATLDITEGGAPEMGGDLDPETGGLQELVPVDVVRPIYLHPYFLGESAASIEMIASVRVAIDEGETEPESGWSTNQKILFQHLAAGMDTYRESAYEFRRSYRANSTLAAKASVQSVNTVTALPALSTRLAALIDGLPTGEWLKQGTSVQFLGREGWDIRESWLWAPQWSVVYGGTFTGGY